MTVDEALSRLEALGNGKVWALNIRNGADDNQYGVKLGDIRTLAKTIKTDHALALELWETGNLDARLLAILLMRPKALSADELDGLVRSNAEPQVSDWLNAYIVKAHPEKEALRQRWMSTNHLMAARAGWSLTAESVAKAPEGLDLAALLDRIETELAIAAELPRWTMNNTLAAIGIHHPAHRDRALEIGAALGFTATIPRRRDARPPSRQSGSPKWCGGELSRPDATLSGVIDPWRDARVRNTVR